MRYPARETAEKHEQILNAAARLFRERGFAGAGVAEIMKAAGLTHGAFYAHFPSKGELAAEALARAFAQSEDRIYASAAAATSPKQAFLDSYLSSAHRNRPGEGCAIAALGPEIARDPAVRGPFTAEVKRMIARMAERFESEDEEESRRDAIHLLAAAVGAMIMARAVDDPVLSEEIISSVRESLAST
jgi:TetR/AcrR family transcriptional regulator, transcriptional repressor for nem operon